MTVLYCGPRSGSKAETNIGAEWPFNCNRSLAPESCDCLPEPHWRFTADWVRWRGSPTCSSVSSTLLHSVGMDFAGLIAANWAKRAGIGHVVQVTESDLNAKDGRMTLICRASPWVHAVACNSDALVREFRQRYPEFRNVQRAWRGVDLIAFRPTGSHAVATDARGTKFLYLGGLPASGKLPYKKNTKGGQTLMSAWPRQRKALISTDASLLLANIPANETAVERWQANLKSPQNVTVMGHVDPKFVGNPAGRRRGAGAQPSGRPTERCHGSLMWSASAGQ